VSGRTFAIGDIHGDLEHLMKLLARLPSLDADDTIVFLGDYLDRGPASAQVMETVRALQRSGICKVVTLRGNHEDAWVRVIDQGWPEFVLPPQNGCAAAMRSFTGGAPAGDQPQTEDEWDALLSGSFFPDPMVEWMRALEWWYEDEHAIYVHAGLPNRDGRWMHPSEVDKPLCLLWTRSKEMFREYRGKMLVIGHTVTSFLPQELSEHTPCDPDDLWASEHIVALDTGCGKGGFLTAIELPRRVVYESRG
jgi:serine/threonine protein phosphatase 1